MRCKKVLERLPDHVDGLLASAQAEAIRDHLDLCHDCRATSLALKAATASLAAWEDVDPPADCFRGILARLEALPVEAFEHPARRGLIARMPWFDRAPWIDSVRAVRVRRLATGGLAAAAAVLGALVVTRTETHAPRHARGPQVPNMDATASIFQGYDFDNGLLYQRGGRPVMQPARAASRADAFEGSPR